MPGQRTGRVRRRFAVLAAGLALAGLAAAAEPEPTAEWSANVQIIEAQLRGFALERFDSPLPQLRAFDRDGRLVFSMNGYDRDDLAAAVPVVLQGRAAVPDKPKTLAKELAHVSSTAGKRLASLPPAEVTFVEYWAEWCGPCRILSRKLAEHFAAHPDVRINLVHVEADRRKLPQHKQGGADSGWDGGN